MSTVDQRIQKMLKWCDKVAVKWKDGGMKRVAPKYKYNNKHCEKKGGFCRFCKPSRKRAYFCNSFLVAAVVHGLGFRKHGFARDCKKYRGGGTGGMIRRDYAPSVKAGTGFIVVPGISRKHPIFTNTKKQIREAEKILRPGDQLIIGKPNMCHCAIWYGNGLIAECAGDAGCCIRSAKFINRGQGRRIIRVYRFVGEKTKAEVKAVKKEVKKVKKAQTVQAKKTAATSKKYKVVARRGMNIRSGPSSKTKKVGYLKKGRTFTASKTKGSWAYSKANGGWICITSGCCKLVKQGGKKT